MFLGFYLQNILSHEYGIKKPWYFLCTKNFWNCKSEKDKIEEKNFLRKSLAISRIVDNDKSEEINININNEKFEGIKSKDELNDKNDNIDNDKNTEVNDDNNIKLENKFEEGDGIFHVKNIKKDFGEKQVLKGVTFDLLPNEIFVLLGHNGAGKTALISILTGLINADSCSAMFNNYNVLSQENSEYLRKY
jgi:ATPase subunit of ABC transporter with duplicated ATPase domains